MNPGERAAWANGRREADDEIARLRRELQSTYARPRSEPPGRIDIFELHHRMTGHLFPAFSSEDERFLALALCGEAGELANLVKKRWRDKADLAEEIRDEIADIRIYTELLAKQFGIEGDKLDVHVQQKLAKVLARHGSLREPKATRDKWLDRAWESILASKDLTRARDRLSVHELQQIIGMTVGPCADALYEVEQSKQAAMRDGDPPV